MVKVRTYLLWKEAFHIEDFQVGGIGGYRFGHQIKLLTLLRMLFYKFIVPSGYKISAVNFYRQGFAFWIQVRAVTVSDGIRS